MTTVTTAPQPVAVGVSLPRVDGPDKVVGRSIYAADLVLPGMLHARLVRAPHAHALIRSIDASRALAVPGVVRVLTADDLPIQEKDPATRARCPLAWREVVFHGQPVAAVLAGDDDTARVAAALVDVVYEPLPAILDPEEAVRDGCPPVRGGSLDADRSEDQAHMSADVSSAVVHAPAGSPNIGMRLQFQQGDLEEAWAKSDVIIEHTYRTSAIHQGYLEPQAAVADYTANGDLTVWSGSQGQFRVRSDLALMLGIPESRIRVVNTEVGGGFGGKSFFIQPVVASLAVAARRPVRIVLDRAEDIAGSIPAPQAVIRLKTGCTFDGDLTGIESTVIYDAGAFPGAPLRAGPILAGGNYRFPAYRLSGMEAVTNKVGVGAYRAPGAPEVAFALESSMSAMAKAIGMDPIAFRLRHVVVQGNRLPHGVVLGPVGSVEALEAVRRSDLWQRSRQPRPPGRGFGVAQGGWLGGTQPAGASVRLNNDGTFTVIVGANDIAGTNTGLLQIAAEVLQVPAGRIQIVTGDTDSAPYAGATNGSKITYTVGMAVMRAAEDAIAQLRAIGAAELETTPDRVGYDGAAIWDLDDPEQRLSLTKVADLSTNFGARYRPVNGIGTSSTEALAPGFSCHAVEVQVDLETGFVEVLDLVAAQDVGRAINPMAVEGQMQGGATQGLAIGLWERIDFDPASGAVLNPGLLDYRMPTMADVPPIEPVVLEVPAPAGPFGARLVGEPSIIPTAAAVADAVADAIGVRLTALPVTPEAVMRALGKVGDG